MSDQVTGIVAAFGTLFGVFLGGWLGMYLSDLRQKRHRNR